MEDTIAAISTALGVGAISIIRVSGNQAIEIVNKIFDRDILKKKSHTIHYGHIMEQEKIIDEVLISIMRAPRTFTREDVVEINCHGGIATTKKVLELLLLNGCRPADPGEFTKRAFLNGRIDLTQAEGIMDLISSKTEKSRMLAINELNGNVSNLIKELRQEIVTILANIEVNIDYPEYEDVEIMTNEILIPKIAQIKEKMKDILNKSENGKMIKEGIKTAIVGRPNVGKSSLLNYLLEEDKAIVTDIAGTTRDIVEGNINIDGILLNIVDTAGIRKTDDIIESIGISKSMEIMEQSDLVLLILNNNDKLSQEDRQLLEKIKEKNHIIIVNKIDLEQKIEMDEINSDSIIYMSMKNNKGVDNLKDKIKQLFHLEQLETEDMTYLTNARSISILKKCLESIAEIERGIKENQPIDMVEIDIKTVWDNLGEIIGETYQDELINQLFSQFCLGK